MKTRSDSSRHWVFALVIHLVIAGLPTAATSDFTEFEDSPFLDPNVQPGDSFDITTATAVPWDAAAFLDAYPDGVKLVRGTLDVSDVDGYSVSLAAGDLLVAALFQADAGQIDDTALGLFVGGAAPLLVEDDDGGSGFLSRYGFAVPSPGLYQVGVTGFGDSAYTGAHFEGTRGLAAYRLVLAVATDPPGRSESDLDPGPQGSNDSLAAADPIPPDGALLHASLLPGDVDYYAIEIAEGDRLMVSVFDLTTGGLALAGGELNDPTIALFDPAAAPAAGGANDDGGPGFDPNLSFTIPPGKGGLWKLAISGFGDSALTGAHQEGPFDYLLVVATERACTNVSALISNLVASTPQPYAIGNLQAGDHYYTDRLDPGRHVLVDIPARLECMEWIRTANDDKIVTLGLGHLTFTLAEPASIFVAFDTRATAFPPWLDSGFTPLNEILDIADSDATQEFVLLRRDFAAGPVSLGGNREGGPMGANSNYVVIAKPLDTSDPEQALTISGTATGGSFSVTISGVIVSVVTSAGQTAAQVASALAAAINADSTLAAARIFGLASGSSLVTTGSIEAVDNLDSGLGGEEPPVLIPVMGSYGLLWLVLASGACGLLATRRVRPGRP